MTILREDSRLRGEDRAAMIMVVKAIKPAVLGAVVCFSLLFTGRWISSDQLSVLCVGFLKQHLLTWAAGIAVCLLLILLRAEMTRFINMSVRWGPQSRGKQARANHGHRYGNVAEQPLPSARFSIENDDPSRHLSSSAQRTAITGAVFRDNPPCCATSLQHTDAGSTVDLGPGQPSTTTATSPTCLLTLSATLPAPPSAPQPTAALHLAYSSPECGGGSTSHIGNVGSSANPSGGGSTHQADPTSRSGPPENLPRGPAHASATVTAYYLADSRGAGGSAASAVAAAAAAASALSGRDAARARLDANRAALNAKLAGHPMSSLAHYNCAVELTRHITKEVVYPSPYVRGRSAYKLPGGEPEDALEGWRHQVGQALRGSAGEGRMRVDAAYLRRGCILLVVEYSGRRQQPQGQQQQQPQQQQQRERQAAVLGATGYPVTDSGSSSSRGSCWGDGLGAADAGSVVRAAAPMLSFDDLMRAFGRQLVQPEGDPQRSPGGPRAQQYWGPTGGDVLAASGEHRLLQQQQQQQKALQHVAEAERGAAGPSSAAAAAAEPGQLQGRGSGAGPEFVAPAPRLVLLDPPCVLASQQPLCLHVLTYAAPADAARDDTPASAGTGAGAGAAAGAASGHAGHPSCYSASAQQSTPRLIARYGCLDAAPQPCCVVVVRSKEAQGVLGGGGDESGPCGGGDDGGGAGVVAAADMMIAGGWRLFNVLDDGNDLAADDLLAPPAAARGQLFPEDGPRGRYAGASDNAPAAAAVSAAASWSAPGAVPCAGAGVPVPTPAAEPVRAATESKHASEAHGGCTGGAGCLGDTGCAGCRRLCVVAAGPCPHPGMMLLERDLGHEGEGEGPAGGAPPATGTSPPLLSAPLPVVVVDDPAVQYEVNLVAAAAAALGSSGVAAEAGGADPEDGAVTSAQARPPPAWLLGFLYDFGQFLELSESVSARTGAPLDPPGGGRAPVGSGAVRGAYATFAGWMHGEGAVLDAGADGGGGGGGTDLASAGPLDSDTDDWLLYDTDPDRVAVASRQEDEQHLLGLAAGLALYACRQGLPALLSYVLTRTARAGVPVLQLDGEVGRLYRGGLGLAHMAVLSGSAEVLQALLLLSRDETAALPAGAAAAAWTAAVEPHPETPAPDDPGTRCGLFGGDGTAAAARLEPQQPALGEARSCAACAAACSTHCKEPPGNEGSDDVHLISGSGCEGAGGNPVDGMGGRLASLSACTALFVRPGPGGVTPLHLLALMHGRVPGLVQPLLSLCPLAAHAWVAVLDDGGSSAEQYALQAGACELNEQFGELATMEALEAAALGCDAPELVLAAAMAAAAQLEERSAIVPPALPVAAGPAQERRRDPTASETAPSDNTAGGPSFGWGRRRPTGGGEPPPAAAAIPGAFSTYPQRPRPPGAPPATHPIAQHPQATSVQGASYGSGGGRSKRSPTWGPLRGVVAAARRLPWAAPLRGFADPSLERAFAGRAATPALKRNRYTLAFYVVMLAGCVQKTLVALRATSSRAAPSRGSVLGAVGELLVATAPAVAKVCASGLVAALRLRGVAHDCTLAAGDLVRGLVVAGVHVAGRPHPEPFKVTDLTMQETLTTLFHCLMLPVMEQMSSPLVALAASVACSLMEWPLLLNHGWHGTAATCLLLGRFLAGLAVRYCLQVWARASYLRACGSSDGGESRTCFWACVGGADQASFGAAKAHGDSPKQRGS